MGEFVSKHKQRYWVHSEPVNETPDLPEVVIEKCVGRHEDPVGRDVGYLCTWCFTRMRRTLTELPAMVIWLEAHLAAGGSASERVSGTREDPIPLRLDILDLIGPQTTSAQPFSPYIGNPDDQLGDPGIESFLRSRSEQVHWETGSAWPEDHSVTGFVAYLAAALRWVADQDWCDEFFTELLQIASKARRAAPWHEVVKHEKNAVCEKCGSLSLVIHLASETVKCERRLRGCGYERAMTEYEWISRGMTEAG